MSYEDNSTYAKYLANKCREGHEACKECQEKDPNCGCCPPGLVAIYDENGKNTGCLTATDAAQYKTDSLTSVQCPNGYVKLVRNSDGKFLGCVSESEYAALNTEVNGSGNVTGTGIGVVTSSGNVLGTGLTAQAYAIFTPLNTTDQRVTWTSTDASKASISSNGVITGLLAGTTTIKATSVADNTIIGALTLTITS